MATLTYQERFKTLKNVFDEFTNRNIFELQSRKVFDQLLSPVKVGKESNVFLAKKGNKLLIIKIYRVQNCNFNKMFDYIRVDPRYEYLKKHRRDIIFAWVQREYKNLLRAQKAGINAPKPYAVKYNLLVEEMIGNQEPALALKDKYPKNPEVFFQQLLEQVHKLYQAGIVHGDLSAFNILNFQEKPYCIDFSQATLTKNPNAEALLERDIKNLVVFFRKLGVKVNSEEILLKIKGEP